MKLVMSYVIKQFPQAPFARAPFGDSLVHFWVPKGPFRTKNVIAMETRSPWWLFCYRGRILLSVPIRCHISQEKQHPNCYRGSELPSR